MTGGSFLVRWGPYGAVGARFPPNSCVHEHYFLVACSGVSLYLINCLVTITQPADSQYRAIILLLKLFYI